MVMQKTSDNQAEGATSPDEQVSGFWERLLQTHETDITDITPDMKLIESRSTFREYLDNWQIFQYCMNVKYIKHTHTQAKINKQVKRKLLTPGVSCADRKKIV